MFIYEAKRLQKGCDCRNCSYPNLDETREAVVVGPEDFTWIGSAVAFNASKDS